MNRSAWNGYVLVLAAAVIYAVTANQVIAGGNPEDAAAQAVSSPDSASTLPAAGRPDPAGPIKTNLCELSAAPERFQGKEVEIRAIVQTGFQTSLLRDDTCSTFIWLSGIDVADGTTPDSATATLKKDPQFQKMLGYLDKKYKPKDGAFCARCPLYKVTATITGRFEHVRKGELDATTGTQAGFGYLHSYDSQITVRAVSNPVAEPINR